MLSCFCRCLKLLSEHECNTYFFVTAFAEVFNVNTHMYSSKAKDTPWFADLMRSMADSVGSKV